MLRSHRHHDALLTAVVACWVRKHELSTSASPSDMHRMALSAHSEKGLYRVHLYSMQKRWPRFTVAVQRWINHVAVHFAMHKELCAVEQSEGSVRQGTVWCSHDEPPHGSPQAHLHTAHSTSNTALIKWLDEWSMGETLRESGHPFLCSCNPRQPGWRKRWWGHGKKNTLNNG